MNNTPRTDACWENERCNIVMVMHAQQLERELVEANRIIKECLSVMPVGYIPSHTPENIPSKIEGLAKDLAESTVINERLERELAEALEWKHYLSSWGGTPEIVYSFIQGQHAQIRAAQEVEKQLSAARELAESNGKLAHDNMIKAMRYREELSETRKDYACLAERLNGHDATECLANLDRLIKERDLLIEGLEKLASCDWVITLPDRMDAVREIARQTIEIVRNNKH